MARSRHYSPTISRYLVSVLYHYSKAKKRPMTKIVDQLLRQSLARTEAWKTAESLMTGEPSLVPQQSHAA